MFIFLLEGYDGVIEGLTFLRIWRPRLSGKCNQYESRAYDVVSKIACEAHECETFASILTELEKD
jgi:hypothetical protein